MREEQVRSLERELRNAILDARLRFSGSAPSIHQRLHRQQIADIERRLAQANGDICENCFGTDDLHTVARPNSEEPLALLCLSCRHHLGLKPWQDEQVENDPPERENRFSEMKQRMRLDRPYEFMDDGITPEQAELFADALRRFKHWPRRSGKSKKDHV